MAVSSTVPVRWAALAGLSATLTGIGLARFAYTPLIPALIAAGWFSASEAAYLGAANLAGYLAGAFFGRATLRFGSAPTMLRLMMLLTAASLFACDWRAAGFAWFLLWRFVSGVTGGIIMVLAATTAMAGAPPERAGRIGGAIFTGIGLGVAAGGTLVPLLLRLGGLDAAWLGLGGVALALTLFAWRLWPEDGIAEPAHAAPAGPIPVPMKVLLVEYGLAGAGLVAPMLFLVVFIARGLGQGIEAGAAYWVLYGVAAMLGPGIAGTLADRIGFDRALRLGFVIGIGAMVLPVFTTRPLALGLSSALTGGFTIAIVPLAFGRIRELVADGAAQRRLWSYATVSYALLQALAAYLYSYLLGRFDDYALLFLLGALVLALALALDLAASRDGGSAARTR